MLYRYCLRSYIPSGMTEKIGEFVLI
jgi:hypothetical protein